MQIGEELGIAKLSERVNCNLCGRDDTELLLNIRGGRSLSLEKASFNIVRCKNCGLVYVNPRLSGSELTRLYDEDYYSSDDSVFCGYESYVGEKDNFRKSFRMRLKTIKQFSKKGRILDVGCAYGFFLEVAEEEGWEGYGVEISEYAARYAKEELGLKVSLGELKEVRYPSEYFEVVTLWDVIEHLPDPLGELKEINRILRKGGIVALSTPAIDSLFAKLSGKRWIGFQCPWEHIYYFSRSTISKLLEKAGFEVVRIGTIGRICDLRYIADRFKLYSSFISRQLEAMIDKFPYLNNFKFYIDPHHTMVAYARKLDE